MSSHSRRQSQLTGAFGCDSVSITHGAGATSRSPSDAAHAGKSGREQSAPPMNGAQSQRPSSALQTPWRSQPGAHGLRATAADAAGGGCCCTGAAARGAAPCSGHTLNGSRPVERASSARLGARVPSSPGGASRSR